MAVVAAAKAARGRRKAKSWDYCAEVVVQFFCGPEREGGERRERERERGSHENACFTHVPYLPFHLSLLSSVAEGWTDRPDASVGRQGRLFFSVLAVM